MTDKPPSFAIISLGCPKNLVDSEYICERFAARGYVQRADPSDAEVVIVNTCAFLTSAVDESIQTLLEQQQAGKVVIGAGCLVSRYQEELLKELPEIRLFAGPGTYGELPDLLDAGEHFTAPRFDGVVGRTQVSTGASAYVKLSEGCSNHCHYCLIPSLRGELVSKPLPAILDECRRLADQGVKELILIGQDLGSYGQDLGLRHGLNRVLEAVAELPGIVWVRPLYVHPAAVDAALIQTMAQHPRICKYLEMPVQHVAQDVLERMGRRGGAAAVRAALELLKEAGLWLRTTLMVGHPGEDEAAFKELEDLVAAGTFDSLGAFAYSPEAGTPSALLPRISAAQSQRRLRRIMALQKKVSRQRLKRFVGQTLPVLLEGYHAETELLLAGRSEFQAPQVDGQVLINEGAAPFGSMVEVEIIRAMDYDLVGRIT